MKRLLWLLISLAGCKSATWQPFALDQRVEVVLPFPPHLLPVRALPASVRMKPVKAWYLVTLTGTYQFTRAVNSAKFFSAHDTLRHAAFFARYQRVLQWQHAHHISSRPVLVAGLPGREFRYYTRYATPCYLRCFLLDSVGYAFTFQPTRYVSVLSTLATSQREWFFNSITVKGLLPAAPARRLSVE